MKRFLTGLLLSLMAANSAHGQNTPPAFQSLDVLVIQRDAGRVIFQRCDAERIHCRILSQLSVKQLHQLKFELQRMPAERFAFLDREAPFDGFAAGALVGGLSMKGIALLNALLIARMHLYDPAYTLRKLTSPYRAAYLIILASVAALYGGGEVLHQVSRSRYARADELSREKMVAKLDVVLDFALNVQPGQPQAVPLPEWLWDKI